MRKKTKNGLNYNKLREISFRKNLIDYCKIKLNKLGHTSCNGRLFNQCKHTEIKQKYRECFSSEPIEDFGNYLKRKEERSEGLVYVIGNRLGAFCKIGFTRNVHKRIVEIQTGCPLPLEIFCVVYGTMKTEQLLHKKYKEYRLNGEWFKYEGLLKENIEKTESVIQDTMLLTKRKNSKHAKSNIEEKENNINTQTTFPSD